MLFLFCASLSGGSVTLPSPAGVSAFTTVDSTSTVSASSVVATAEVTADAQRLQLSFSTHNSNETCVVLDYRGGSYTGVPIAKTHDTGQSFGSPQCGPISVTSGQLVIGSIMGFGLGNGLGSGFTSRVSSGSVVAGDQTPSQNGSVSVSQSGNVSIWDCELMSFDP